MPPAIHIFTFILGSAVVIFGAYYATYLIANGSRKITKGRAIQVLDRFSVTKDKSVILISVYGKVYLAAFSQGAITLLDTLDEEAARQALEEAENPTPPAWGIGCANLLGELSRRLRLVRPATHSTPFEAYLQQGAEAKAAAATYQKRQDKEEQNPDVSGHSCLEEDILK